MAQAQSFAARQDFDAALRLGAEAISLDPQNLDHQQQLNQIVEAAVALASQAASQGEPRRALAIANQVLAVAPQHAGARSIANHVHQRLAADRFARAESFERQGLLGNALVELAACVSHVPTYPNAQERLSQIHTALRGEVTLRVAIDSERVRDETVLADLFSASEIVALLDPALAVTVTDTVAPDSNLVLSGESVRLAFDRDQSSVVRTCEYVCGVDHRPNPDHARAERDVMEVERLMASEEEQSARLEAEVNRCQREVDQEEQGVSRAEADVDRARRRLHSCRERHHRDEGKPHGGHGDQCRSERERLESEQRDLERARRRLEGPRRRLVRTRDAWTRAREGVHRARRARNDALERMRSTPRMIALDRICPHDYRVEQHRHLGRLTLDLAYRDTATAQVVLSLPHHQLDTQRVWETYDGSRDDVRQRASHRLPCCPLTNSCSVRSKKRLSPR